MFPAARVSDNLVSTATNGSPVPIIPPGTPTVLIGGKPAARVTDPTAGGGIVMPPGELTVLIGG